MKNKLIVVALAGAALGLAGCSSTPKAPKCPRGTYVQINTPDCYVVVEGASTTEPRRTSCPVKTTETRQLQLILETTP